MTKLLLTVGLVLWSGCNIPIDEPPAEKKQQAPAERIVDETHKFAKDGLIEAKLVDNHLLGKDFMPGGNFAEYEANGKQYQVFFTLRRNADRALFLFTDYKDVLTEPKFIPHLGGYFGSDGDTPTLVFQKNKYVIGIVGLDEQEADNAARTIAAYLN